MYQSQNGEVVRRLGPGHAVSGRLSVTNTKNQINFSALKIANKQKAPDLVLLPVPAPEAN